MRKYLGLFALCTLPLFGSEEGYGKAPATIICPANVPHQLINVGNVQTKQLLVVGIDSEISDSQGNVMNLPWR